MKMKPEKITKRDLIEFIITIVILFACLGAILYVTMDFGSTLVEVLP